jgi:sterol desaturase/sphingolipid hydroxylase (fatty acid hydroxylase superfamily)
MDDPFMKEVLSGIETFGLGGAVLLFMVLCAEMFIRWREGKSPLSKEALNSALFFGVFGSFIQATFYTALLIAALFPVYHLTPLRIPVAPWSLPIYFLIGELAYYWYHRIGHEVRLCWADHSIHHSAGVYDFTVNLRHVPFEALYRWVVWAPFIALGFHPLIFVLFTTTAPSFQTFCHTTRIGRFHPWFEWIFVTPKNHGVHHASNEPYLDKNYGGLLMIWDHLFGTYQRMEDDIPPHYGITHPLKNANPFSVVLHEFIPLFKDFAAAPTIKQKLGVLFGRPGFTFELPRGKGPNAEAAQLQAAE